ncbi:MAG TPA: choice-of-anchor Q domain-containing protein, partial [Pyrinomonadaceae bacterium]|nr:choice-of-anchor Q domain-containing protein [Pyrinomonadaceae bacterium]
MCAALTASTAKAAVFTVDTTADNETNGCAIGQCTLREAIADANFVPGSDSINFQAGLNGTVTLTGGALFITSDITINGPGARILSVSGGGASRVFVTTGSNVTARISGLTVTGGNAQPILIGATLIGDGGGILNANGATLNLSDVNISGNSATSLGGGIATRSILGTTSVTFITRSLISGNSALAGGGGISNIATAGIVSSAVTSVTDSTVTLNNTVAEAGGISNVGGTVNLVNDTITHNASTLTGGGIVNVAGVLGLGVTNLRNTIVAFNNAVIVGGNLSLSDDALGVFNSLGNNLLGNNLNAEASFQASVFVGVTPVPNVNGDIVGSVSVGTLVIDPKLGPLANNGGPTDTRAVLAGSPALNRGNNCVQTDSCASDPNPFTLPEPLLTDQRGTGFPRIGSGTVEIGAYELQVVPTAANVSVAGQVLDENGNPLFRVTVKLTDSNGNVRQALTNQFGYFKVEGVTSGETYIAEAIHRQYAFDAQVICVFDEITDLKFTARQETVKRADKNSR